MTGCTEILGRKNRDQLELFVSGSLEQLVPEDHVLARVDRVLDLGWLHEELADCYCPDNGRPGIDPEVAVRLMLAGLLLGIVHDRRLLREAQVNLAIRWFIGYSLHERLPDHSSLTRIRQRWGETRSREIFRRTVTACLEAKIPTAEVVHIDASLTRLASSSMPSAACKALVRVKRTACLELASGTEPEARVVSGRGQSPAPDSEPERRAEHPSTTLSGSPLANTLAVSVNGPACVIDGLLSHARRESIRRASNAPGCGAHFHLSPSANINPGGLATGPPAESRSRSPEPRKADACWQFPALPRSGASPPRSGHRRRNRPPRECRP